MGNEMGEGFGRGLLRAAGVGERLELRGRLGGDRDTALRAVAQMMRAATHVDLSDNQLTVREVALLRFGDQLLEVCLSRGLFPDPSCTGRHTCARIAPVATR